MENNILTKETITNFVIMHLFEPKEKIGYQTNNSDEENFVKLNIKKLEKLGDEEYKNTMQKVFIAVKNFFIFSIRSLNPTEIEKINILFAHVFFYYDDTSYKLSFIEYMDILNCNTHMQYFSLLEKYIEGFNYSAFIDLLSYHSIYAKYDVEEVFEVTQDDNIYLTQARRSKDNQQYNLTLIPMTSYLQHRLQNILGNLNIKFNENDNINSLYAELNKHLKNYGYGFDSEILSVISKAMSSFNNIRNKKTSAHANELLSEPESKIIYNYMEYIVWLLDFLDKELNLTTNKINTK